jgi:PAS domain-containing protein
MRQEPKNSGNALEDGIETESRLQLIVDTTPALIDSARPDGYIDFFNQHCLEFVGVSFEEMSGWGWTKTIHPLKVFWLRQGTSPAATWSSLFAEDPTGKRFPFLLWEADMLV